MEKIDEVERKIIDIFATISNSIGYSDVHGKIIAALIVLQKELSLDELAKKTKYSTSMISLSLDLLEVLGLIKKIKKPNDRKLYIRFEGDLLEALRVAILLKFSKGFEIVKEKLKDQEKVLKEMKGKRRDTLLKNIKNLEREIKRIKIYVDKLSKVKIPK